MGLENLTRMPKRPPMIGGLASENANNGTRMAWSYAGVFATLYIGLSVLHHRQMMTGGFDLGIFQQAIKAYAHAATPLVPLKGATVNILGDHFSPIIATLAPVYVIFPSALTLLVAQSLLTALSVVPLVHWAYAAHGQRVAAWIAVAYGLSWGLGEMIHFDFHEVAFAVPLIAFSLSSAGQLRWNRAILWALPLVLVKEDMGLTVAAIGCYVAWKGPRRKGISLALFGLASSTVEILIVIPKMNSEGSFSYGSQIQPGQSLWSFLLHTFTPAEKWVTVLMILAATGFLAVRSPLVLLVLPTLAWRFTASNAQYWGILFHYNAILMPIAFAAVIDGLSKGKALSPRAMKAAVATSLLCTACTLPVAHFTDIFLPRSWMESSHTTAARHLIEQIPDGAVVDSTNHIAAQLVGRAVVSEACAFTYSVPNASPGWIIVDTKDKSVPSCQFSNFASRIGIHEENGYVLVQREDGISLLRRVS